MASLANIKGTRDIIHGKGAIVDLIKRQSFLVEMEFKRRLIYWNFSQGNQEYKDQQDAGGLFMNLIYKYITLYYQTQSTPKDLIPYFPLINTSQLHPLREKLQAFLDKMLDISTNKMKCLKCILSVAKVLRILGVYSPPYIRNIGDMWESASFFLKLYSDYSRFQHTPRKNEVKLSDQLLLLSLQILMQTPPNLSSDESPRPSFTFQEQTHPSFSQRIFFCIGMLSYGIQQSPFNNQMKFKLMQLYQLSGNILSLEQVFSSMEMKPEDIEKKAFLFFRAVSEKRMYPNKLMDISEKIKRYHREYHSELVPHIQKAYTKNDITQIKNLFYQKESSEKSYYLVLAQYQMLNNNFLKNMHLPQQQLARILREGLSFLNVASKLPNIDNFSLTPDPDCLYYCGSVQVKLLRDVRLKTPYITDTQLSKNIYAFRELVSPQDCYGLFGDPRYIRLEAIKFKLILDISERNLNGIDEGLRNFHAELYDLDLLEKPALAKGLNFRPSTIFGKDNLPLKEQIQQARLQEEQAQKAYDGKFDTESQFWEHSKKMEGYFWKFVLMLFEGAFRLICSHPAQESEKQRNSKEAFADVMETQLTYKLTSYPHIIRHFEIMTLMLRDIENQVVPREDYLKKLKLGLSNIISNMEVDSEQEENFDSLDDTIYPGMISVVGKFILGPLMLSALLLISYANFLPNRNSGPEGMPEMSSIIILSRSVQAFDTQLRGTIQKVKGYLNAQKNLCLQETMAKRYMNSETFRNYSQEIDRKIFQKMIADLKANKDFEVNACLNFISQIERIHLPMF